MTPSLEPAKSKSYGCQTYDEAMQEYYDGQQARANAPLPRTPPPGWDWDLWFAFRMGVEAERHGC